MDQWRGKVALVTGASAGIGASIARELCRHGVVVVGMARRMDRLDDLKSEIARENPDALFHGVKCDLRVETEIEEAFEWVFKTLEGIDILVNNAGLYHSITVLEGELQLLKDVVDVNLMAVVSCTQKAFKSMKERDVPGYIITISSVDGYSVSLVDGVAESVYSASKHGVRALNTVLRHELNHLKRNKIRVSNISPGFVNSEMSPMEEAPDMPHLEPQDIADTVVYLLGTNPRVQVEDVIIRPTGEAF